LDRGSIDRKQLTDAEKLTTSFFGVKNASKRCR